MVEVVAGTAGRRPRRRMAARAVIEVGELELGVVGVGGGAVEARRSRGPGGPALPIPGLGRRELVLGEGLAVELALDAGQVGEVGLDAGVLALPAGPAHLGHQLVVVVLLELLGPVLVRLAVQHEGVGGPLGLPVLGPHHLGPPRLQAPLRVRVDVDLVHVRHLRAHHAQRRLHDELGLLGLVGLLFLVRRRRAQRRRLRPRLRRRLGVRLRAVGPRPAGRLGRSYRLAAAGAHRVRLLGGRRW